ncbi:MAG: hypothetical protein QOF66_6425 [Mycobacterium sp.]|nr:hypothetical protein [Mycobacterium sp.]
MVAARDGPQTACRTTILRSMLLRQAVGRAAPESPPGAALVCVAPTGNAARPNPPRPPRRHPRRHTATEPPRTRSIHTPGRRPQRRPHRRQPAHQPQNRQPPRQRHQDHTRCRQPHPGRRTRPPTPTHHRDLIPGVVLPPNGQPGDTQPIVSARTSTGSRRPARLPGEPNDRRLPAATPRFRRPAEPAGQVHLARPVPRRVPAGAAPNAVSLPHQLAARASAYFTATGHHV